MKDPYKVLGISRSATDDEIKHAYRELAKKYHPDNYANDPLADLAEEKMKEINEAYDAVQKERAGFGSSSSYDTSTSGFSPDNESKDESSHSGEYTHIRVLLNSGNHLGAESMLNTIPSNERGAEWNFLYGCVLIQKGWTFDAQRYFEKACYMDPANFEYKQALNNIKNNASSYGHTYRNTPAGGGCSGCDICSGLICADCLCECCGSDLISCC